MKYFVVADIHGYYTILKNALDKAGFNPETDTLISLGDALDRGPEPNEVIHYLINLPHKILIRGNHEDTAASLLYMFDEPLYNKSRPDYYDETNGTFDTIRLLAQKVRKHKISKTLAKWAWDEVVEDARRHIEFKQYMSVLVDYYELDKYVFVHGWIPVDERVIGKDKNGYIFKMSYRSDWRDVNENAWYQARWMDTFTVTQEKVFEPNKIIVCGHWGTFDWWERLHGKKDCFDIYKTDNFIGLDATTAYSKKINVMTFELENNNNGK